MHILTSLPCRAVSTVAHLQRHPLLQSSNSFARWLTFSAGLLSPITYPNSRVIVGMAWQSSGATNTELVENLWRNGLITQPEVKAAFLKVDRANHAPSSPYQDSPQPIGHGATISAPHMHASAIEHLLPALLPSVARPAPRVLDIGSGSGYLTQLMAELAGQDGVVVGVEHITALRELGRANVAKSSGGRVLLDSGRVRFRLGDGRKGWREEGAGAEEGWDAIHVGASARVMHAELVEQLRAPGILFIPLDEDGGEEQHVWRVEKDPAGRVARKRLFGVRYVPLTDAPAV